MSFGISSKVEKEEVQCQRNADKQKNYGTTLGVLFVISLVTRETYCIEENYPPPCDSTIYCHGNLLHTIQMKHLYVDSKTFVDMKMKYTEAETWQRFHKLMNLTNNLPTRPQLARFINDTFDPAGSEFEDWKPNDWIEKPKFLKSIKDPVYRKWASDLNALWMLLGRKMKEDVGLHPEQYSIIHVPHPVIVPGGRFREFYYWDSYWIIKGLLLSEMYQTTRGMLENFLSIVDTYGFIPNGGRIYYLQRSQPPLLVPMLQLYFDAVGYDDLIFLNQILPTLEKEYSYWMTKHSVLVEKDGKNYTLSRYMDVSDGPRPESYREDYESGAGFRTDADKRNFYSELKAGAESGWDFSSRWFIVNGTNKGNLTNIKTRYIIPVDLNAMIYWNAVILSDFFKRVNNLEKSEFYRNAAMERLEAVTEVLWHDEVGAWLDYDIMNEIKRDYFYPTNLSPLWTGCYDKEKTDYISDKTVEYIQNTGVMVNLGGIPTTLEHTGEQWDYPNAWPPAQHMVVVGLHNTKNVGAQALAYEMADRWVRSNYKAYNETHAMYEKYDASVVGGHGTGGEYETQLGFGWTNGVIMDFLNMYGGRLDYNEDEFEDHGDHNSHSQSNRPEVILSDEPLQTTSSSTSLLAPLIITVVIFVGLFVGGSVW